MVSNSLTRREVSIRLMSILSAIGFLGKAKAVSPETSSTGDDGISRTCECIHQEVVIKASRARLYQALTDGKQFGRVTDLVMPGSGASAFISPDLGAAFSIFRGVVPGDHLNGSFLYPAAKYRKRPSVVVVNERGRARPAQDKGWDPCELPYLR